MRQLQTNAHCKNLILYHLIFVCKYRKKCFSDKTFAEALKAQFEEISKKYDFSIDTIDLDYSKPDHIHLLVRSVPKLSPLVELYDNHGERLITKVKVKDFVDCKDYKKLD